MGSVDASASSEPPTVWNRAAMAAMSVIPNQIPRFILQGVENRCQLCQCAGPVGRLDIGRAAESVCQFFQDTAAEINTPGIRQSRRLMLRQHDGLPGGETMPNCSQTWQPAINSPAAAGDWKASC